MDVALVDAGLSVSISREDILDELCQQNTDLGTVHRPILGLIDDVIRRSFPFTPLAEWTLEGLPFGSPYAKTSAVFASWFSPVVEHQNRVIRMQQPAFGAGRTTELAIKAMLV